MRWRSMTRMKMPEGRERPPRAAAAEYIAMQASRLARMATANEFPLLAYLIDMAVLEAWREASEPEPGAGAATAEGPGGASPRKSNVA